MHLSRLFIVIVINFIHMNLFWTYDKLGDDMDKVKIGIPRALHYYYYGEMWKSFLEELGFEVVESPKTTKKILDDGCLLANDEMCLSLKIYLGHIQYLQSKCHYILVPRIDNYGVYEQTCTNFLGLYDIVRNLCKTPLLTYNVDVSHHCGEMNALMQLGMSLGKGKEQSRIAYVSSINKLEKRKKKRYVREVEKLNHSKKIKLLVISHPYNFEDSYIGDPIKKLLNGLNVEYIDGELFAGKESSIGGTLLSPNLYWKYNKELIGTIHLLKDNIDGVLFLSSFPCGPDSLVNELIIRKIKLPHLNLIVDEESGSAGMETRLESFIDILEQKKAIR